MKEEQSGCVNGGQVWQPQVAGGWVLWAMQRNCSLQVIINGTITTKQAVGGGRWAVFGGGGNAMGHTSNPATYQARSSRTLITLNIIPGAQDASFSAFDRCRPLLPPCTNSLVRH